jgi:hypothetical protein
LPTLPYRTLERPDGSIDTEAVDRLLEVLFSLYADRLHDMPPMDVFVQAARERVKREGYPSNPVSRRDAKTGCPGTYRPVEGRNGDSTCPPCPYRDACYGQASFVGFHQSIATGDLTASLVAAACAFVTAARYWTAARLHIAGDFANQDGQVDWPYVAGLELVASKILQEFDGIEHLAFTYTHFQGTEAQIIIDRLRPVGIVVRKSDAWEPGGAVVRDFADVPALRRATGLDLILCPAQISKSVTCASCTLCWTRPTRTIVFAPHGPTKNHVRKAAAARFIEAAQSDVLDRRAVRP